MEKVLKIPDEIIKQVEKILARGNTAKIIPLRHELLLLEEKVQKRIKAPIKPSE